MRFEPHPIELCDRGNATAQSPKRPHIVRRQQQPEIAAPPALGNFHEPAGHAGRLRHPCRLERLDVRGGRVAGVGGLSQLRFDPH